MPGDLSSIKLNTAGMKRAAITTAKAVPSAANIPHSKIDDTLVAMFAVKPTIVVVLARSRVIPTILIDPISPFTRSSLIFSESMRNLFIICMEYELPTEIIRGGSEIPMTDIFTPRNPMSPRTQASAMSSVASGITTPWKVLKFR